MKITPNFAKEMRELAKRLDMDFVMKEISALTDIEYPQTFEARKNSARYTEQLLKNEGFSDVERVDFPADGKTAYQDKRMPISWDVSSAKLTVLSNVAGLERKVIADYSQHPYSVVWGSVSTPEGGINARIIAESEVFMGEDARGALVLLENNEQPREALGAILDLGAIGFVSERVVGALETPDEITWINNATEDSGHWHVQSDDRDFIGFSITPRDARALRAAVSQSEKEHPKVLYPEAAYAAYRKVLLEAKLLANQRNVAIERDEQFFFQNGNLVKVSRCGCRTDFAIEGCVFFAIFVRLR